jgi:hypothetical protein
MEAQESEIEDHHQRLLAAFGAVLRAEDAVSDVKRRQTEAEALLQQERNRAESEMEKAWEEVGRLMAETGEPEVLLPGEATDFKIAWSTPRETVKAEPDATPDEFCKIERRPKLKEIGEHLKQLRKGGIPLPNWATFQLGTSKLGWKAVKKTTVKSKE